MKAKAFFRSIASEARASLNGHRFDVHYTDGIIAGDGATGFIDGSKLSAFVGTCGLYKPHGRFRQSIVSDEDFSKVAVAIIHESRHAAQRFGMVPAIGDTYYLMHDCNQDLYDDCYLRDLSEVDAEMYGVREYGKWCKRKFGSDELAAKYVKNRMDDIHDYWLDMEDFSEAGVDVKNMKLNDTLRVFEQKFKELSNTRYWYENRPFKNRDTIRQVLDMDNRDGFQRWGKVFDELCECGSFEESCRKISSLCLLGHPEKREAFSSLKGLDAKKEIRSFIPESEKSIRERCSGNLDAKRVYRIDQTRVQEKYGDVIVKARQSARGSVNKAQAVPVPDPKPVIQWKPLLLPPPMLPDDMPEVPDVGHDGPEF